MAAEQVLNHVLPAMAGVKPNTIIRVEYRPSNPVTAWRKNSAWLASLSHDSDFYIFRR